MRRSVTQKQMSLNKATVLKDFPKARAIQIPRHNSWRIYFNVLPRGIDDGCSIYCESEAQAWEVAAEGCREDRTWVELMQNALKCPSDFIKAQFARRGMRLPTAETKEAL